MSLIRAVALCLVIAGCASTPEPPPPAAVFHLPAGPGAQSAWFADEHAHVIYFGLSDFWTAFWASGDPLAELRDSGAQRIGRFDLASESFLPPLVVRESRPEVRASVWDVLAHSNGWVYFTTFYDEMGRVDPATGIVERFSSLGRGLNELAAGPDGRILATRYGAGLEDPRARGDGSLVMFTPEGRKLREIRLHARDDAVTAAKSVAFDPRTRHVFVNADVILDGGGVAFARFELDADLALVEGSVGKVELLFAAFAADGKGALVEDDAGELRLTLRGYTREPVTLALGPRDVDDFAQDIHFASDGTVAVAFWSGRVVLVRKTEQRLEHARVELEKPAECAPPAGRSLIYSAFVAARSVYATLYCGETILRAPLPAEWKPVEGTR